MLAVGFVLFAKNSLLPPTPPVYVNKRLLGAVMVIPDVPLDPEVADVPLEPDDPLVPDEPEVADVPLEPEVADVPELPDVPLVPEVADVPLEPLVIGTDDVHDANPVESDIRYLPLEAPSVILICDTVNPPSLKFE